MRKPGCDVDECGRQVHSNDVAAVGGREEPRRAAEAASEIKHFLLAGEADARGKFQRCRAAPRVEFVDGREIVGREMVEILAGALKRADDRVE